MTGWRPLKLSKGSLLLLHLAAAGHVWRGQKGLWYASTENAKRNVDMRINKMINIGVLSATYQDNFLTITDMGRRYLDENPIDDFMKASIIR